MHCFSWRLYAKLPQIHSVYFFSLYIDKFKKEILFALCAGSEKVRHSNYIHMGWIYMYKEESNKHKQDCMNKTKIWTDKYIFGKWNEECK